MIFNTILFLQTNPLEPEQSARLYKEMTSTRWIKSELEGVWTSTTSIHDEVATDGTLVATTKFTLGLLDSALWAAGAHTYSYICQAGNAAPVTISRQR